MTINNTIKKSEVKSSNFKPINPDVHTYPDEIPGHFKTILLDPPWSVNQRGARGAGNHYDLMTMEEIKALPVNELLEENGHVWLWMTNGVLPYLPEIMDAWNLTYRSIYHYLKPRLSLGMYLRNSSEQLILATKGKAPIQFHGQMNWSIMPVLSHSEKPSEVMEVIERCSKGPYLELFARQRHPGWYVWGREAPGSDIIIPDQPVPEYSKDAEIWLRKRQEAGDELPVKLAPQDAPAKKRKTKREVKNE